jgi:hypothetical protein
MGLLSSEADYVEKIPILFFIRLECVNTWYFTIFSYLLPQFGAANFFRSCALDAFQQKCEVP